jgi:alkylhydroperoxidase/carboxymuconolactone decarboxylase family protein YurZ
MMIPEAFKKRCCPTDALDGRCCGTAAPAHEGTAAETPLTTEAPHPRARTEEDGARERLEDLIPIAVVITAGCESCAESMVRRAVEAGSAPRHVLRTLAIVADLSERECFRKNIAPEVVARMKGPLARARKTLDEAAWRGAGATGCT